MATHFFQGFFPPKKIRIWLKAKIIILDKDCPSWTLCRGVPVHSGPPPRAPGGGILWLCSSLTGQNLSNNLTDSRDAIPNCFPNPAWLYQVRCSFVSSTEANTSQEIRNHVLVVFIVKAANLNPIRKIMAQGQKPRTNKAGGGVRGAFRRAQRPRGRVVPITAMSPELREASSHGAQARGTNDQNPVQSHKQSPVPRLPSTRHDCWTSQLTDKETRVKKGERCMIPPLPLHAKPGCVRVRSNALYFLSCSRNNGGVAKRIG